MARPVLILADEPTGNLDRESGAGVLDLLRACCTEEGAAVVLATHDPEATRAGDGVVRLVDGRVEPPGSAISPSLAHQWLR
jgi:putative ABC transport system ATP-binding protein